MRREREAAWLVAVMTICAWGQVASAQTPGSPVPEAGESVGHMLTSTHHLLPLILVGLFSIVPIVLVLRAVGMRLGLIGHSHGPQGHGHGHEHHHGHGPHGHTHGVIDATIATTERGIWAIKWSFAILAATALMQVAGVLVSGSVALLADTIHNVSDATTAIPLWIAFVLARRRPSPTFTYGLGRVEDLAGILIVLIILFSALAAGYQSIDRLLNPRPVTQLGWLVAAGLLGFVGNEAVAWLRLKVGREINSAALVADGHHARIDGLTSLAVVAGAVGVWLGFPLADPVIGLLITLAIFGIVWQSARSVLTRMLDGLEPGTLNEIRHAAEHVPGVSLTEVRARWIGHKLHADLVIATDEALSLGEAKDLVAELKHELHAHMPALASTSVQFTEAGAADAGHAHHDHGHAHDHGPAHAHPHDHGHAHGHGHHGHGHAHAKGSSKRQPG